MIASMPPTRPSAEGADRLPNAIDGYRVVRVVSTGARAVTALVHAEGLTRVARVFRGTCPTPLIDAEVAAHDAVRAASPALREHAVALDDLVTLPDGRLALILDQVGGPALDAVLAARRGRFTAGEAVTVLAPIIDAVEAAHAVGLTGIGLSAAAVRLSPSGAPVLTRLHEARVGPALPDRFRDREPAYAADRAALERLGASVAAALPEPARAGLRAAMHAATLDRPIAVALFDFAEPLPLLLDDALASDDAQRLVPPPPERARLWEAPPATAIDALEHVADRQPARASTVPGAPASSVLAPDALPPGALPSGALPHLPAPLTAALDVLRALGLPAGVVGPIQTTVETVVARTSAVGARLRDRGVRREAGGPLGAVTTPVLPGALAPGAMASRSPRWAVRPRFLIGGAAGGVALVAALALLGGASGADDASPDGRVHGSDGTAGDTVTPLAPIAIDDAGSMPPSSSAVGDAPEVALHPEPEQWQGIVEVLLDRWRACRRESSAAGGDGSRCGRDSAHPGSAAEQLLRTDDPRHAQLDRWSAVGGEAVVVDRMGGAVLVDLVAAGTPTASLLVVRSEAGWRVRDVIG